jgi:site-specific DNA-methyltransferase (adenine-specific)
MNIETLRIAELTPDPNNARQHDDKNLKAIMGSLKEFGQRKPIVITEAGTIVAGNGTVEAAKRLGWLDIEVVRVPSDWTDAQVKAFAIADNRTAELANWNQEVLTSQLLELEAEGWELAEFGFEAFELPDEDKPIIEDEIPESAPGRVALGDIWQLGNHRLMCGDSFDRKQIDTLMDDQKADVVFTDPPYGMNLDADYSKMLNTKNGASGKKHSQVIGDDLEFDPSIILDVFSYCDEILLWGFDYYADKLPQGTPLVWDKRVEEKYDAVIGSAFELLWSKKKRKRQIIRYNYTSWGARMADNLDGSKPHPTMKPVAMTVEIIKMTLGQNIVDLFGGSGSTLIAAEQTNRICYMMELDPKYCDVIIERWERLTGQKAELLPAKAD